MRMSRIILLAASLGIVLAGCTTDKIPKQQPPPGETVNYAWQGFPEPVSSPAKAKILVEQRTPKTVKANDTFSCTIDVTNRADFTVTEATLKQNIPSNFKLINSNPKAEQKDNQLTWVLKNLTPGANIQIVITGKVSEATTLKYIGNTRLSFVSEGPVNTTDAVRAGLTFGLNNPKVVTVGEVFPVDMTFKNPGTGTLANVKVIKSLPAGLLTADGKSRLSLTIGDIASDQTQLTTTNIKAEKPGLYSTVFDATAEDGISASAKMEVRAIKPNIVLTASAPSKRYIDKPIPYKINVKNNGDAVTKNITVKLELPDEVILTAVNENGTSSKAGQLATWNLSYLVPDATATLTASAVTKRIMVVNALASAETKGQDTQKQTLITDVSGIPGLLVSLSDINDPVPLGGEEIYTIVITNQGFLPATKIKVKCALEDSMQFVKAEGATKGALYDGDSVVFEPLAVLEPQAEAKWQVTVKALKANDVRFKIDVTSDQLERPVHREESTHFYE